MQEAPLLSTLEYIPLHLCVSSKGLKYSFVNVNFASKPSCSCSARVSPDQNLFSNKVNSLSPQHMAPGEWIFSSNSTSTF